MSTVCPDKTSTDTSSFQLTELVVGQSARIVSITDCPTRYKKALAQRGILPNTHITLLRKAPLGDPLILSLRGTQISLRLNEAKHILLSTIDD